MSIFFLYDIIIIARKEAYYDRKKILSLALSATILFGLSGCKSNTIKREYNEKTEQFEYTGMINSEAFKDLYVLEYIDSNNDKYIRLAFKVQKSIVGIEYKEFFNGYVISNDTNTHILNIKPLSYYIKEQIKDNYTGDEIEKIYNIIKENYYKTKKLELKK